MTTNHARSGATPLGLALILALGAPAAVVLAPAPALAQGDEKAESGTDTVHQLTKDGKTVARKGEIVEITAGTIKLRTGDGVKQIKRAEVARWEFGGEPEGLRRAAAGMNRGDFDAAATAAREVVADCESGKVRPIFKQRALLEQGRALVAAGKFGDAGDALQAGAKATPQADLVRECMREAVRAHIRGKNPQKAMTLAGEAAAAYKAAELSDDAMDEAKLLVAEAKEASGNNSGARSDYNLLTNSRDARVKGRALLGAARMAFLAKEVDRAESQYRQILGDPNVERWVRCGAARGLGDVIMSRPNAAKDFAKLRAAATAYAQSAAVHFPARGEPTEDREAALHEGARTYDLLAEAAGDKDVKAKEIYGNMARQMRAELVRLYRNSPFREENEQKLARADAAAPADEPK